MNKLKLSYIIAFLLFLSTSSQAQVGQVISLASRYVTLLKSNQNDVVYASEASEAEFSEHLNIAILPFAAHVSYLNPKEINEQEALEQFETEQMLGKMLQEQFWDVFDNYESDVYLQDVRITNKILEDIGYFTRKDQFPPSYLAQILQVDAVILCTFDIQIDNTRTGWQNLTKALGSLAMSQVTGFIPGLDAVGFIKDPKAIIKIVTNPGEFYNKLKTGDITALTDIAGSLLPEGEWKKVANLVAKNSQTVVKAIQGDKQNLFSDLISNNISLLSSELNLNPTVSRLITNNVGVVDKVISGNTQGLMFDIISNNVSSFTAGFVDNKNTLLSNAINNNSTIIAKLASGDTSNLLQDVVSNNLTQVTGLLGEGDHSFYTNMLVNNKDLITKVINSDFENLTTELLSNNLDLVSGLLPDGDLNKVTDLLAKKDLVKSLLDQDMDGIVQTLTENGVELLGESLQGVNVEKFAETFTQNKALLNTLVSGDKNELLNFALQNSNSFLDQKLNAEQAGNLLTILSEKGDVLKNAINGDKSNLLSGFLVGFDANLNLDSANKISSLLLNNQEVLPAVLKGNKEQLTSLVNDSSLVDYLMNNKGNLNQLIGMAKEEDFSILGKSAEDIQMLSFQLMENQDVLSGIISGDSSKIITSLAGDQFKEKMNVSHDFFNELSGSLVAEKANISNVIVNSKVNQMLLNKTIDIQFFDFGIDALLEEYENVYLRDKTVTQTIASILDPTTDPKDQTKVTINIFSNKNDEILWQYINQHDKARLYDMDKTVTKIIKRVNKRFPYFSK